MATVWATACHHSAADFVVPEWLLNWAPNCLYLTITTSWVPSKRKCNCSKHRCTAEKQAKKLEDLTLDYSAHDAAEENDVLSQLFDLSLLKFQQRDDVAATFRNYSRKVKWAMRLCTWLPTGTPHACIPANQL